MPKRLPPSVDLPVSRPVLSPEARQNQLIAAAYDLIEKRILEGTASSQETTALLKMGSTRERLEQELLQRKAELEQIKAETLESEKRTEEKYNAAIEAFKRYSGANDG